MPSSKGNPDDGAAGVLGVADMSAGVAVGGRPLFGQLSSRTVAGRREFQARGGAGRRCAYLQRGAEADSSRPVADAAIGARQIRQLSGQRIDAIGRTLRDLNGDRKGDRTLIVAVFAGRTFGSLDGRGGRRLTEGQARRGVEYDQRWFAKADRPVVTMTIRIDVPPILRHEGDRQ